MENICAHTSVDIWDPFTIEANMGRNSVVVAVLLEHSVNVAISRESTNEIAKGGIVWRGDRFSPNHLDRFDTCKGSRKNTQTNV